MNCKKKFTRKEAKQFKGGHIVIPPLYTDIDRSAFADCASLASITIPDTVTSIGNSAFAYCTRLTNITLPKNLKNIGERTFSGCKNLANIIIPKGVATIESSVFLDCTRLAAIKVDENNQYYSSEDGILFNKDKTELIIYPAGIENEFYTIPDGVTVIGDRAFMGVNKLTGIAIPDSVTTIEREAFANCENLASAVIPNSVTIIKSLTYENCRNLTTVVIPNSVTSIKSHAFSGCTNLTEIALPDNKIDIEYDAFDKNLTEIKVSEKNQHYSSEGGVLFNKDKTELIRYPQGLKNDFYIVPASVTSIMYYSFEGCRYLTHLMIPDGVTIEARAFSECYNLTVYCSASSYAYEYCKEYNIEVKIIKDGVNSFHRVLADLEKEKSAEWVKTIDERDEIWHDKNLYFDAVKKVGLKDYDCYDVYSLRNSPYSYAIYISTDKDQWESFREALAFCMIRKLFIRREWILPNQKLSGQNKMDKNDYGWVKETNFMGDITSYGSGEDKETVCPVSPHETDIREFNIKSEFNLLREEEILEEHEYKASRSDIELMKNSVKFSHFISIYDGSYGHYFTSLFGETEDKYILMETAMLD